MEINFGRNSAANNPIFFKQILATTHFSQRTPQDVSARSLFGLLTHTQTHRHVKTIGLYWLSLSRLVKKDSDSSVSNQAFLPICLNVS